MASPYDTGRATAQNGGKAPPPQPTPLKQNQADWGFNSERNLPRPTPPRPTPPTSTTRR